MNQDNVSQLHKGINAAFIQSSFDVNPAYKPQFVSNNHKAGRKVLSSIESELKNCDEFSISVAFITMSGITPLLQTLKELESRGIPGRIMTTDYLNFSEPKALDKLASLRNLEIRMFCADEAAEGFHTKGYIFREKEIYRIIVGSSNMTLSALTRNKEWNSKLVSTEDGEYTADILREYEELWTSPYTIPYEEFIENYRTRYELIKEQRRIAKAQEVVSIPQYQLQPNSMQVAFVNNMRQLKEEGTDRALLISATGTGKTYASAFAVRDDQPKRTLFLVHREQIAKQAMESYKRVIGSKNADGSKITYGLLSGNSKDYDSQFLFSTMQMMAKEETLARFAEDAFDFIIIDETHRAAAESYQRILSYFKPRFLLGMTASPERSDQYDVFSLYHHHIAYEIRLQQALEENLLCPFHYFGITDLEIDGEVFDDQTGLTNFAKLVSDQRVDYIIKQASYYGHSGDRVKGLIFCSRKEEARELSAKFNERGFKTMALGGEDSQEKREEAIELLTRDVQAGSESGEDYLDYIFTVDIFNEGVDIPEVNQVIMLRPTQSPIVFVQQLGRGLRKASEKEYVVILDFIGNYMNNFMIPIALSGDRSYNKDTIRHYVREGSRIIPGSSTIHFDEISRKRIFASIDAANFNDARLIKECYKQLRYKLGRIPSLMDFETYGSIDPLRIFDNKSMGSYHKFLSRNEKEYKVKFNAHQESVLECISKKFASGKRPHELLMLYRMLGQDPGMLVSKLAEPDYMLQMPDGNNAMVEISASVSESQEHMIQRLQKYQKGLFAYLEADLKELYRIPMSSFARVNITNIMTNEFTSGSARATYADCIFIEQDGNDYSISEDFRQLLANADFYKAVKEVTEFGLYRNLRYYSKRYADSAFTLYSKYTYDDVCRLLNWEKGEVALNIGGYKYDRNTKTYPVFINYDKTEDIQDTIRYEDRLLSPTQLIAISKSKRTAESEDVRTALHAKELGVSMELFVRKNKDDKISKEFYYLGRISATGDYKEFVMPNTNANAVEIFYNLDTPVREDIYDYIVG